MKGSLFVSIRDLVQKRFGDETWHQVLAKAGLPATTVFMAISDVEDELFVKIVYALSEVSGLRLSKTWEIIAEQWICTHTRQAYPYHYEGITSAREFILQMNQVHSMVTRASAKAKPPRFEFEQSGDGSITVRYVSERGLTDYFSALLQVVGRYFKEDIHIESRSSDTYQLVFR